MLSQERQGQTVFSSNTKIAMACAVFAILLGYIWLAAAQSCLGTTQYLISGPYQNYFYSDCHVQAQAVVTSPLPESNLTIIGPRLIVAFPGGNSGFCTYFAPQDGKNGTLGIELVSFNGSPLSSVYNATSGSQIPVVGVTGVLSFNKSAALTVPILGSVRTLRDFVEGPSLLQSEIQDAIMFSTYQGKGASLSRLWLDNVTTSTFTMTPYRNNTNGMVEIKNKTLMIDAGLYTFTATYNYAQLEQLTAMEVLSPAADGLITQKPQLTIDLGSLSFLSYTEKLLAGAWRFLTYFGRDSMISALLLQPILSQGNGSAMEAVLGAVLERMNSTDGSVCHEETIGDYATWLHLQDNVTSTAPSYSYVMIDSDFYLPVLMDRYLTQSSIGQSRMSAFLSTAAGSINPANMGYSYGQLLGINAAKVMNLAAPFAAPGGQIMQNLAHLKEDQIVGQWRDSTYGIGGGRIPFDVNTALMPAALRAIASLSRANSSIFPSHPKWGTLADDYASVWEAHTLPFFQIDLSHATATTRLQNFMKRNTFYTGPTHASSLPSKNYTYYGISLNGYDNLKTVDVQHTDTCFHLFLLNTTNDAQLSTLLNATANSINLPFPAGLNTPVGIVVANPALGKEAVLTQNYTTGAYHGTVVWSWQQAMMAKGLELQLGRCTTPASAGNPSTAPTKNLQKIPSFCGNKAIYNNVKQAYNTLWDLIEANSNEQSQEVWSWTYKNGKYQVADLGTLTPPPGVGAQTESDIRQLWSLTFLAVTRDMSLK